MINSVGKLLDRAKSDGKVMRIEKFAEYGRIVPDGVKNAGMEKNRPDGVKNAGQLILVTFN